MSDEAQYPLVTFALFAYNQEKYIREAVEGALAQDYPNLEIIISDDCSTDGTFDAIKQAAAPYVGKHLVVARRTARNLGSLLHVADVAALAKGELLVLAAGDDVSKPDRTRAMVAAWQTSQAWGMCSRYDRVSAHGHLLEESVRAPVLDRHGFDRFFHPEDGVVNVVHGCTSAYDRRIFDQLHVREDDYILAEDGAISVVLNLLGKKIVHLDDSLVQYRENPDSLTNSGRARALSFMEIERDEERIVRFAKAQANRCCYFKRIDALHAGDKVRSMNMDGLDAELRTQEAIADWYRMGVSRRARCLWRGDVSARWGVPRVLGRHAFYLAKWMASRIR